MKTLNYTQGLTVMSCCACGIDFAVPEDWRQSRVQDRKLFYCPNGHTQSYQGKSREQELAEKLEREKQNVEFWRKQEQAQRGYREKAEHQRDAYKGHTTRLKKRVAKGKCPCCSNTFVNLQAHMTKRHPDYGVENP